MAQRAFPLVRTADDLALLPDDGNRYELIDGALFVTPAPSRNHQRVLGELYLRLRAYAAAHGLEVLMAPVDVRASSITQVEPDLLVIPRPLPEEAESRWLPMARLLLAVEILSPSTARNDRGRKRQLYLTSGVVEYWIVDPEQRVIEVWNTSEVHRIIFAGAATLEWCPSPGAPLRLAVCDIFASMS